jgi:GAF domain-containing protein
MTSDGVPRPANAGAEGSDGGIALARVTRLASWALRAPIGVVTLVKGGVYVTAGSVGVPESWSSARLTSVARSVCEQVLASGEPLVVSDARTRSVPGGSATQADVDVAAYAGVPLIDSSQRVLGALCVLDTQPRVWAVEAGAMLDDLSAVAIAELEREAASSQQARLQRSRQGLLAVARQLAAEPRPERVLRSLVEAAVTLLSMDDGGVARWDAGSQALVQVESFLPSTSTGTRLDLAATASGRAAVERRLVVWSDYQRRVGQTTPAGRVGADLVAAIPLQHESRLLGTLSVSSFALGSLLLDEDAAVLELLASLAAAVLVGQERARLAGAVLAALTAQHELANALTAVSASVQLIRRMPDLPASVQERADTAIQRASFAAVRLQKLQQLNDLVETDWGRVGRTIDVDRSI